MPGPTQTAVSLRIDTPSVTPPVLLPWLGVNVLSLDAPLVAIAWQTLFAESAGVTVSAVETSLLALAVWVVYALDRVLDARSVRLDTLFTARHRFAARYQKLILVLASTACAGGLVLALASIPMFLWRPALTLSGAVLAYLAIVHCSPAFAERWWPKELMVGVIFALGVGLVPWHAASDSALAPGLALFGGLCCLNCLLIDAAELTEPPAARIRRALEEQRLSLITILLTAATASFGLQHGPMVQLYRAETYSALFLLTLYFWRNQLTGESVRLLADLALLTPLPFLLSR